MVLLILVGPVPNMAISGLLSRWDLNPWVIHWNVLRSQQSPEPWHLAASPGAQLPKGSFSSSLSPHVISDKRSYHNSSPLATTARVRGFEGKARPAPMMSATFRRLDTIGSQILTFCKHAFFALPLHGWVACLGLVPTKRNIKRSTPIRINLPPSQKSPPILYALHGLGRYTRRRRFFPLRSFPSRLPATTQVSPFTVC
jgi:hypothetical protein